MIPAKAEATEVRTSKPPVMPPTRREEVAAGKKPYQRLPALAPNGNEATAAFWVSAAARAGPRDMTPGVTCFTAIAPAPTVSKDVVISAAAARVPSSEERRVGT